MNQSRPPQNAARRTVTVADSLRTTDPVLAGRLSIAAWRLARAPETRSALVAALGQAAEPDFTPLSHNSETSHASLSPDGTTLRVQQGERVQEWNVATRAKKDPYTLRGAPTVYGTDDPRVDDALGAHPGLATWSPDGRRAADQSADGSAIVVWDVPTGARHLLPIRDSDAVFQIVLGNGGNRTAISTDTRVEVWDLPTRKRLLVLPGPTPPSAVALSRDGTLFARCGPTGRIELRSVPGGKVRPLKAFGIPTEVRRHPSCRPGTLQFSPDRVLPPRTGGHPRGPHPLPRRDGTDRADAERSRGSHRRVERRQRRPRPVRPRRGRHGRGQGHGGRALLRAPRDTGRPPARHHTGRAVPARCRRPGRGVVQPRRKVLRLHHHRRRCCRFTGERDGRRCGPRPGLGRTSRTSR